MEQYVIKANVPVTGKHWELQFIDGVAETTDRLIAESYGNRGYDVSVRAESKRKNGEAATEA